MLGVYVCAFALHAAHFGRAHQAGEGRIFGEVFEVAAAEWGAVRVHGRRVHADDAPGERLIGVGGAHLLDQFHVPGHAHEHFGGVGVHLGAGEVETVESLRAVDVGGGLLADRFDGGGLPTGVAGQFDEFVDAHLLHELIPLLVVVVHAGHVVDLEAVVGTGGRRRIVGGIGIVGGQYGGTRPVGFEAFLDLGRDRRRIQAAFDFREGARQIRARQIGHVRFERAGVLELLLGGGGHLVGGTLAIMGVVVGDGVFHRVGEGGVVVLHGVTVGAQGEGVVAFVHHVGSGTLVVEGGHVVEGHGQFHFVGFAGLEFLGLGERAEVHRGLFDAALGVWGAVIQLHHVLAGDVAGVGHLHGGGHFAALTVDLVILELPVEGGVAQAIAERVLHDGIIIAVIVDGAVRGGNHGLVGCGGLIPTVAGVDVLFEVEVLVAHLLLVIGVIAIAHVVVGRGALHVVGVGVHEMTARIDLAE